MATTNFVNGSTLSDDAWFNDVDAWTYEGLLLGGQLIFPATAVPSANVNTLDDYEEGTFTPTISFGGSSAGVTYTTQAGYYQKIGNRVNFKLRIILSNNGSGSGAALIEALPFTSANSIPTALSLRLGGSLGVISTCQAYMNQNASTCVIETLASGVGTQLTEVELGNTADIMLQGTYEI